MDAEQNDDEEEEGEEDDAADDDEGEARGASSSRLQNRLEGGRLYSRKHGGAKARRTLAKPMPFDHRRLDDGMVQKLKPIDGSLIRDWRQPSEPDGLPKEDKPAIAARLFDVPQQVLRHEPDDTFQRAEKFNKKQQAVVEEKEKQRRIEACIVRARAGFFLGNQAVITSFVMLCGAPSFEADIVTKRVRARACAFTRSRRILNAQFDANSPPSNTKVTSSRAIQFLGTCAEVTSRRDFVSDETVIDILVPVPPVLCVDDGCKTTPSSTNFLDDGL